MLPPVQRVQLHLRFIHPNEKTEFKKPAGKGAVAPNAPPKLGKVCVAMAVFYGLGSSSPIVLGMVIWCQNV